VSVAFKSFAHFYQTSSPSKSRPDSHCLVPRSVVWALTIVVLIKYAVFALEFGTIEGEGGPFAVYTSLFPPPEVSTSASAYSRIQTNSFESIRRNAKTELSRLTRLQAFTNPSPIVSASSIARSSRTHFSSSLSSVSVLPWPTVYSLPPFPLLQPSEESLYLSLPSRTRSSVSRAPSSFSSGSSKLPELEGLVVSSLPSWSFGSF